MKYPVITADDFRRLKAMIRLAKTSRPKPHLNALERELRRATLVTPRRVPRGVVTMNSRVRVRDVGEGEPRVLTLAYPHHVRGGGESGLSVLTPLGTALLGRRVGDVVFHCADGRSRKLRVEEVLYQPETAGDLHL